MDDIATELGLPGRSITSSGTAGSFSAVVHCSWLQQLMKDGRADASLNVPEKPFLRGENVAYPWKKVFIRVLTKKSGKVLPLPSCKSINSQIDAPLTYSQLLQYIAETNQRNLWKEAYKNFCQSSEKNKDNTIVNLLEHDQLLSEVILRIYGCNIIRIKSDGSGLNKEYTEIVASKYASKSYETHPNMVQALFALETDNHFFIIYNTYHEHNLFDCLTFSPALLDCNYTRGMFVVYQLLHMAKATCDRGLSIGNLMLHDIYLTENLWLQILPEITNNIRPLDPSLIHEQIQNKAISYSPNRKKSSREEVIRNSLVSLEKMLHLWLTGRISNLDYLLHLNELAGRRAGDPHAHLVVPWLTDFSSRCGKNWRDLTKSKYRLTKGDRQLDMTYDVLVKENSASPTAPPQTPHHVSDVLSDITYYVYTARRTPKEILCKYVRNNWVPAEYPVSIQRMQEWTPDECIPEFFTDPTVFKSLHEDLPDLEVPSWATCVEDFIVKHREALESSYVSEHLHHWIDLTFGYKLSGTPSVKAKNVCLSLVDGHSAVRRGGAVQLFSAPHPARPHAQPATPYRIHWVSERKKIHSQESSEEVSEEEDSTSLPQHVSRLSVPAHRPRPRRSSSRGPRARSACTPHHVGVATSHTPSSSTTRHYRVQRSEIGKGIYLPKDYNPVKTLTTLEALNNFEMKCFYRKYYDNADEIIIPPNLHPIAVETKSDKKEVNSDGNSFTNHMFLASYELNYLKKMSQDVHIENILKERKNRSFNNRYTTDGQIYKQFVTESRRQTMMVIGCIIVEIFLHSQLQPLRTNFTNFFDRYRCCQKVFKYGHGLMPKCVSYVAGLLLNVDPPGLSFNSDIKMQNDEDIYSKTPVTNKGLPPPTPSQLLQKLLSNHLIPFPDTFNVIYRLLVTLHEYEIASKELCILYTYNCDGEHCEMYQHIDKTKLHFIQKIAEGKVQACASHLEVVINKLPCYNQFDVVDILLPHYVGLLANKDTSILSAWYLFDTVSKALGPLESRKKLLRHILNLYEDDDIGKTEQDLTNSDAMNKRKSVKLYHNIFLLHLIVRFGLRCFLDHFTQHLVEAVGGYKDNTMESVHTFGHACIKSSINVSKRPRYSDETVKSALYATGEILSPDTSYSSENVVTPGEKVNVVDKAKVNQELRGDPEVFHFERDTIDNKDLRTSRSKSPSESIESFSSSNAGNQDVNFDISPSPTIISGAQGSAIEKVFSPTKVTFSTDLKLSIDTSCETEVLQDSDKLMSPNIPIPASLKTSHHHFGEKEDNSSSDEIERRNKNLGRTQSQSYDCEGSPSIEFRTASRSFHEGEICRQSVSPDIESSKSLRISDMSAESLIWLAHRLGPVLTCRYITRNLLKMLTLCYIGKDNLAPCDRTADCDDIESTSIADGFIVGDRNALKVIKCLTSIVALYGEQLILFQYLPHMGELIASCRRRLSVPLEGGLIACLQLLKHLIPLITDVKLMEQLQDVILKLIVHPSVRLIGTSRPFPSGLPARAALARKLLDALYVTAVRVGPEMTRTQLCVPALQRFFLTFDKATGKTEHWNNTDIDAEMNKNVDCQNEESTEGVEVSSYVEICRDGTTAEWCVRDGRLVRGERDLPGELACSPPGLADSVLNTAQEELLAVFNSELAYKAFLPFYKLVGAESMERTLKNSQTIHNLCQIYDETHRDDSACDIRHPNDNRNFQMSQSEDGLSKKFLDRKTEPVKIGTNVHPGRCDPRRDNDIVNDHISSSNSFGSNVALVGNRIDVTADFSEYGSMATHNNVLDIVSYKMENGVKSNRHLRGDWLIYWEHEIGRPDKESHFNLKQIKLQSFSGHSHSIKSIHGLDNENSFMSASKDKTVKLWSLRNQGDGSTVSQCQWTYTGHKKGVLSLTFLESLRMAVSSDSVVHIWDPFMESVVSQLDSVKIAVSLVKAMPAPSAVVVAATTDSVLKMIDARTCSFTHDLKVTPSGGTFIRSVCVSPSGRWICAGLASGHLVLTDPRTGLLLAHWKAHDGEVIQLVTFNEGCVVSSGLDQTVMVWSTIDGKLKFHLKGTTEPVHCLSAYYGELISGTTNNRIGVHTAVDRDAGYSSTRLRTDTFRGVLTAMAVLPLNRLLLVGNDAGNISLLC